MKFIRNLLLIPLGILLFCSLLLFQMNLCIRNTILSNSYVSNHIDEQNLGQQITTFISQKVHDIEIEDIIKDNDQDLSKEQEENIEKMLKEYKSIFDDNFNEIWLENQINILSKGIHGYITNTIELLPVVDISPIKNIIPNVYASQIISHSNSNISLKYTERIVDKIHKEINKADNSNYSREKLIQNVKNIKEIKNLNLSTSFVERLVDKVSTTDSNESIKNIYEFMIAEMVRDKLNLHNMKDNLDINLVMNNIYSDTTNPVSEFSNIISWYKDKFMFINMLIVLLLLIIILCMAPKLRNGIILSSILFIASGLGVLASGISAKNNLTYIIFSESNPEILFFKDFILNFIFGISNKLIIEGAIFIGLGIILIIISNYIKQRNLNNTYLEKDNETLRSNGFIRGVKVLLTIISILLIFVSVKYSIINDLTYRIELFENAVEASSTLDQETIINVISDTINADFLKEISNYQ